MADEFINPNSPEAQDWTIIDEFRYHCGEGNFDAVQEIIENIRDGTVPEAFADDVNPDEEFPYSVDKLVNGIDENGSSPVHRAAANGHVDCLQLLKDNGSKFFANKAGNTPLHWAARVGNIDACTWLCSNFDVDVLARNDFGRSALTEAFESQIAEVVTILASHSSADKLDEEFKNVELDEEALDTSDASEKISESIPTPVESKCCDRLQEK